MATDMHEPGKQPQLSSGSEYITDKEDDVKVCDICGDAGQEDPLAICNRCSDGAEHIYCMETMLDELPDGDWLCDQCKFKEEYENQEECENPKVHKFEIVAKTQEQSYLDEDAQHGMSTIDFEAPPKKDGSVIKEDDMVDNRTLNTVTCEKASKRGPVSAETSVPQDASLLSPEDSLTNPDSATKKPSDPEQSSGSWSIFNGQKTQTFSDLISSASRDGFKVINENLN